MTIGNLLSISAGLIMFYSFIPYARDILKGKVKPSRSARAMILLILIIGLLQQRSLGSGWLIAMTVGDTIGAIGILFLSFKRGVGGLKRLDVVCYALLAFDIAVWVSTGNALLALHMSLLADLIAMTPVLIKTWKYPWTETPLFFVLGIVAPLLNIIGAGKFSYAVLLLPIYIAAMNLLETLLITYRQKVVPKPATAFSPIHEPLS